MGQTVFSFDQNLENATQIESNYYIKDNIGQTVLLSNEFDIENSMSLWWNFIKIVYGQYGSNSIVGIVSWLEFARNIVKLNIDRSICHFDKEWPKFTKWTI